MKKILIIFSLIISFFVFNLKVSALDEGVYIIHSAMDDNYVIDANGGKAIAGTNFSLYKANGGLAQKFYIKKIDNDSYSIKSVINDNFLMDVYGGKFNQGSNIQLWPSNNGLAQKFTIKEDTNGFYKIFSSNNEYCVSAKNNIAASFNNIELSKSSNSLTQKFRFEKITSLNKTIEPGLYRITSNSNNNMAINIADSKYKNYTNINLYNGNNDSSLFYVNYLENGYYSLRSYYDMNYGLDVPASSKVNKTKLELYKYNGTDNQKWIIKDVGDGNYNIISKCNYLALDLEDGKTAINTNIYLYEINGSNTQKFKFNKVEESYKTISDGYYFINTALNTSKVLDINKGLIENKTNVQLWPINYALSEKWYIKFQDGYYSILSDKDNNYSLQVDGDNINIGTYINSDDQKWIIKKTATGYYIMSKSGKYIKLENNSLNAGTNIRSSSFDGSTQQEFDFRKTASGLSKRVIEDGIYMMSSALDPMMMIDVYGGKKENGTNVQLWTSNGGLAQKFKITYMENGYYKINTLVDINKSIDVQSSNINPGANALIYSNHDNMNQQWIIKEAGDGYFYIISNCGGQNLDVTGGKAKNGTNIQLWPSNNADSQKFKFKKSTTQTKIIDVSAHQGKIDWDKVADSGVYGVVLRIGYWNTEDARFSEYIKEVKRLNIPYGIYVFSYASTTNGATTEANFTNSMIKKYNLEPMLGIYYDLEDWYISADNTSNILTKNDYDSISRTYLNSVRSYVNNKYKVKIYANLNYANNRFNTYARSEIDWIAHYSSQCGYTGSYTLWQYTSSATLNGINGFVDMNYLH